MEPLALLDMRLDFGTGEEEGRRGRRKRVAVMDPDWLARFVKLPCGRRVMAMEELRVVMSFW